MKKRSIALLVVLLVAVILCSGCSSKDKSDNIQRTQTVGDYTLFQTLDAWEYLNFLDNFDETKYEIINISTSLSDGDIYGNDEFYMVTYRRLAQ